MSLNDYFSQKAHRIVKQSTSIKDSKVFNFNYIPEEPMMREEVKPVIDAILRYKYTDIPNNVLIYGPRGTGKSVLLQYIINLCSEKYDLPMLYVNCRHFNTSFKILAETLKKNPRGSSLNELWAQFCQQHPGKTIFVLDEVDLVSDKDNQMEILYRISRSPENYMAILMSNNPRFLEHIDESSKSSLQPELIYFKTYNALEIGEILKQRAQAGLYSVPKRMISEIAALTVKNTNSDARVAIKTLYYASVDTSVPLVENFERARKDIFIDILKNMNNKNLLILKAIVDTPDQFAKSTYRTYKKLSLLYKETPFSYVYFYYTLSFFQSLGLILLISTKVNRSYTNRIQNLFDDSVLDMVFKWRFTQ